MSRRRTAAILGLSTRTLQRWRRPALTEPRRGNRRPHNALTPWERVALEGALAARALADHSCRALSFHLLEQQGLTISPVTVWQRLRRVGASADRVRRRRHAVGLAPDTSFALKPNDLWCWDITHLRTRVPWRFFYLYVVLDWVSRKAVSWQLTESLSSATVPGLWDQGLEAEGLQDRPSLHPRSLSDRGTQMKARVTLRYFRRRLIEPLYARPRTPNDNPEIEAFFATLKTRPSYPGRFATFAEAERWCAAFIRWYNEEHHHSSLNFVTPAQRHAGEHDRVLLERTRLKQRLLEERKTYNRSITRQPAIMATTLA